MQHLGVLEQAGVLLAQRRGRHRWNYFNPLPTKEIHDRWIHPHAVGAVSLRSRLNRSLEAVEVSSGSRAT